MCVLLCVGYVKAGLSGLIPGNFGKGKQPFVFVFLNSYWYFSVCHCVI